MRIPRAAPGKLRLPLAALALLALTAALSTVAAQASTKGTTTLVVMDGETDTPTRVETYNLLDREFEKRNPGVKIKRVSKSFNDLTTTIKLILSGPNPPDVIETNQGYPTIAVLAKAGLLKPLDGYAKKFGWFERQPKSLMNMARATPDGTRIGAGRLWGMSATGDAVGVYYNKAKLQKLALRVPATFGDFEKALAAAKQAGEVPLTFGNLDKWPGIHQFQTVQNSIVPRAYIRSLIFGYGTPSFLTPGNKASAAKLQDWARRGYMTSGFNGVGYDVAWKKFAKGEGVFFITGTWLNGDLFKAMGKNVGFFLMPSAKAGEPPASTSAGGLPWSIPSKSKNPDLAAAYIDFVTGPDAAKLFVKRGDVAALGLPASAAPAGTSRADVLAAWLTLKETNGFIPFLDWATPTFYDTTTATIQELLGLKISADEFVKKLEADYAKFIGSR